MDHEVEHERFHRRRRRRVEPALAPTVEADAGQAHDRLALMRRVAVMLFLVGAGVSEFGALFTQRTSFSRQAQTGCSALLALCGLYLLVTTPRLRAIQCVVVLSVVDLGVVLGIADPIGMGPLFLFWPLVYAAYFFSRRILVLTYAVATVALTVAVAVNSHIELKVDTWIGTISSIGLMAGLVSVMTVREERLRHELQQMASTDPLTGLLNRRAFDPRLHSMFAEAAGMSSPLTVVMFDLDHFKRFNDEHGHLIGDRALQRVADVLRGESRDGDAVSRFGGEEFAVALLGCDVLAARAYTLRVARALASHEDDARMRLSASAGISALDSMVDATALLARADAALYAAKQAGRARAAWWDGGRFVDHAFALDAEDASTTV
jgi:diguanylate cyclase (GGDEF)-like protein